MAATALPAASDPSFRRVVSGFRCVDLNGDGIVCREELSLILRAFGIPFDERIPDMLVAALDRDGDGFVGLEEFVTWVMSSPTKRKGTSTSRALDIGSERLDFCLDVERPASTHLFLTPEEEAEMERITMFDIRGQANAECLLAAGLGSLQDPQLLVLSVGSSSTQAYDAAGFAASFPFGTKNASPDALAQLATSLTGRSHLYRRALLVNSIGYVLNANDPVTLSLTTLVTRAMADDTADEALSLVPKLQAVLQLALLDIPLHVYNRAKDPRTKRYMYPQILNNFAEALAEGRGLRHSLATAACDYDAVVDWGGGSFKVYVKGQRVGTEIMDANGILCEGGVFRSERLTSAMREIEAFVMEVAPEAKSILIAQTGRARELALSMSC